MGVLLVPKAIAVLLVAIALPASAKDPLPALIKKVTPGIVTLCTYVPEKAMPGISTAFFVAADRLVSARHCFHGATRADVRTHDGQTLRVAGILAEDRERDLVLFQLEARPAKCSVLKIAKTRAEPGERVFTVSSPLGLEWSASEGIVSAWREVPEVGLAMQHTAPISPGSSGCPLLNFDGEVVGVQTSTVTEGKATISAGQGLNFAVPSERIAALKSGRLRPLAECLADTPPDWKPAITRGMDTIGLRPLQRDDFKGSVPFFEAAVKREPQEPDTWFRLGLCQERAGDLTAAVESYKKALALRPDFTLALNNLGAVYNRTGRSELAVEPLLKATRLDPKMSSAFGNLAFAYVQAKKLREAIETASQGVKLDPRNAQSFYSLGLAHLKSGDKAKAREQLKKLLPLDRDAGENLRKEIEKE